MKHFGLLLTLGLLTPDFVEAGTSLREAFFAQTEILKIEEKIAILALSESPDWEKVSKKQKLEAALTAARINFHSFNLVNSPDLTPAEALLLNRQQGKIPPGKNMGLSDTYLEENFPDAASYSLLEWELLESWFGKEMASAHLKKKFPARLAAPTPLKEEKDFFANRDILVVFVEDPFNTPIKNAKAPMATEENKFTIYLSQFPDLEQQAEELKIRLEQFQEPFLIVTKGRASASLQKLLDIQPQLRQDSRIKGWVNWNGVLSGKKLVAKSPSRGLASVQNQKPINPLELKAEKALYLLRKEDIERQPGLGEGFPIVNLLSDKKYPRRESIVGEGSTITFMEKQKAPLWEALESFDHP